MQVLNKSFQALLYKYYLAITKQTPLKRHNNPNKQISFGLLHLSQEPHINKIPYFWLLLFEMYPIKIKTNEYC